MGAILFVAALVVIYFGYLALRKHAGSSMFSRRRVDDSAYLDGGGLYAVEVVGESHYQDNLRTIAGGPQKYSAHIETTATIISETDNPHDPNACRVEINGLVVGHLSRTDARTYRAQLARAGRPQAVVHTPALIAGGWDNGPDDRGPFGVRLDLPMREV